MAAAAPTPPTKQAVYAELFDAFDRGSDGALDFGDVVWMLKRLGRAGQSLASARNAAVEALMLIGRGEAAIAPPSSATRGARRLDRADFALLLDEIASMAGVDALEAAGKLLARARCASFSRADGGGVGGGGGEGGGGSEGGGGHEEDAAVAREVAAVDRGDSLVNAADSADGAAARAEEEEEGGVRVLPDAEATAAAAAAVAATVAGAGAGGDGHGERAGWAGSGGGATRAAASLAAAADRGGGSGGDRAAGALGAGTKRPGRRALALATDPALGLLFNAWCGGSSNGGNGGGGGRGRGGPSGGAGGDQGGGGGSGLEVKALSLADVAQGLCRLRPPQSKDDVAAALAEAARAVARHDADGDGRLCRAEFASFVSALLSAAGVAFGDAAGALLEVATVRSPNEAMRRTLQAHGDMAVRVLADGRRGAREGSRE